MRNAFVIIIALAAPALGVGQSVPPVRDLGPVLATSADDLGFVRDVVALREGILVPDGMRRLVLWLDDSLRNQRVVFDSVIGSHNRFATGLMRNVGVCPVDPNRFGGVGGMPLGVILPVLATSFLVRFRGDSALWFDNASGIFIVVEPDGSLGRILRPPSINLYPITSPAQGFIYVSRPRLLPVAPGAPVPKPDSARVIRVDYALGATDTIARLNTGQAGPPAFDHTLMRLHDRTLFPFVDQVVATSDGWIAVFRAHEYRLEWIGPAGERVQGTRLPYNWIRFSEEARQRVADSVNAARTRAHDSVVAKRAADSARTGSPPTHLACSSVNGQQRVVEYPDPPIPPLFLISPDDLPAYYPPTNVRRAVLADEDGHIWIRTTTPDDQPGFDVWDVISRDGGIVDRVRIPETRTVVGFRRGGVVYLTSQDAGRTTIEARRVR